MEPNFAFLKDSVFINVLFLKCLEVLGLALILALLVSRLMERRMRQSPAATT